MLPAIYLLAAAVALAFSSDTNDLNGIPSSALPPEPPLPPRLDPQSVPAGMDSRLFRRSGREIVRELHQLTRQAYSYHRGSQLLQLRDAGAAGRLSGRLEQLQEIARRDPWSAAEYNQPEMQRYFYAHRFMSLGRSEAATSTLATNPADLESLVYARISEFFGELPRLSPTEAVVELRAFQVRFDRTQRNETMDPIWASVARRTLDSFPREGHEALLRWIDGRNTEDLLRLLPLISDQLVQSPEPSEENSTSEDRNIWDVFLSRISTLSVDQRPSALVRTYFYIQFLLLSRGETWDRMRYGCPVDTGNGSREICRLILQRNDAEPSADGFDDAHSHFLLQNALHRYLDRYVHQSAGDRASQDSLRSAVYLAGVFPIGVIAGETQAAAIRNSQSLLPNLRGQTWDLEELMRQVQRGGTVEVRFEEFPSEIRSLFSEVPLPHGLPGASLWDFITRAGSSVLLTPSLQERPEYGTVNPLTRALVLELPIDQDLLPMLFFIVMAHEAYHAYSIHQSFPETRGARLLEERNAYLLESAVHRAVLPTMLATFSAAGPEGMRHAETYIESYAHVRLAVRNANRALGFAEGDSQLRHEIPEGVASATLNSDAMRLWNARLERIAEPERSEILRVEMRAALRDSRLLPPSEPRVQP